MQPLFSSCVFVVLLYRYWHFIPMCTSGTGIQMCVCVADFPDSIWTVDLAHLLRRVGLDVCFLTTTLGPNPAYVHESFYMEHIQVGIGLELCRAGHRGWSSAMQGSPLSTCDYVVLRLCYF